MAIDFPASPTNGQTFTSGSVTYTWDGTKWTAVAAGGGATDKITEGNTSAEVIDTGSDGRFVVTTEGSERLRLDSSGRLGIGTTSPDVNLVVEAATGDATLRVHAAENNSGSEPILILESSNDFAESIIEFKDSSGTGGAIRYNHGDNAIRFQTNGSSERARIDSSGRLLVGTSSARTVSYWDTPQVQIEGLDYQKSSLCIYNNQDFIFGPVLELGHSRGTSIGSNAALQNNDYLGTIAFYGSDGSNEIRGAEISTFVDGTPGANDMPGRLVFSVTADGASSPTERMRITQDGRVGINTTDYTNGRLIVTSDSSSVTNTVFRETAAGSSSVNTIGFFRGSFVGTISTTTTATAYNTSSDYRLKENVVPVTDGIARLQQLKPSRFNFIADTNKTVDGFIAHEVQTVVPEAITGEKDAVDDEGNPEYQGIDQSKLVPLLTAALQEAVAKIESLEARLTAAGL